MDIEIDSDDMGVEMPEGASLDRVGVAVSAAAVPSGVAGNSAGLGAGGGVELSRALVGIVAKTGVYPGMASWLRERRRLVVREDGTEEWVGMRRGRGRILGAKGAGHYYHVMSRTCGGDVWFDEVEKEALAKLIRKMCRFTGAELLTFCVMGNHFHLLVRIPDKERWMRPFEGMAGEGALLDHLAKFYSGAFMEALKNQLKRDRQLGDEEAAQGRLQAFRDRLCDLPALMKELKTRYTKWYNKRHGRRGTLWMERYKSVLIDNRGEGIRSRAQERDALLMMGLYIDLNPVRAGLVGDPAEYRWCGYAAALGGEKAEQRGLLELTRRRSVVEALRVWRLWLFYQGTGEKEVAGEIVPEEGKEVAGGAGTGCAGTVGAAGGGVLGKAKGKRKVRKGVDEVEKARVVERRGAMSWDELLRCRVRYFSDGAVIGSREFVEQYRRRDAEDERRVPRMRGVEKDAELYAMRSLRVDAISRTPAEGLPQRARRSTEG